ncbi:hypothetical protein BpHYR1_047648 [Brachionus plicatilis]|uniref:Uncharacterized protein n=1 Tax=Brachionus plicatilis TaxID=10195 RepID=A0A3M7RXX3_BRAPC|nr:hypothetical protein BpHYR1_047648 [Brachionus plicatilis]
MNIPLERKRRPGRPKATTNALTRQPNETKIVNEESDSDDPPVQEPISKKFVLKGPQSLLHSPKLKKGAVDQNKKIHLFLSSHNNFYLIN